MRVLLSMQVTGDQPLPKQYIAFAVGASWGDGGDPVWRNPLHRKQGKIEAQGYHVFALADNR